MIAPPDLLITMAMMLPETRSMGYIGGVKATADIAQITAPLSSPTDVILIMGNCPGLTASDSLAMRWNGDTAANYSYRNFSSPEILGAASFNNNQAGTQNRMKFEAISTANNRHFLCIVMNSSTQTKIGFFQSSYAMNSVASQADLQLSTCEWVNTTTAITSIVLLCNTDTTLLKSGTKFGIYGRNIA